MSVRSTARSARELAPAIKAFVEDAKLAEREGRWSDAALSYESLVRDPLADEQTRLSALRWLGRVYLEQGNRGAAIDVLEAAVAAGHPRKLPRRSTSSPSFTRPAATWMQRI